MIDLPAIRILRGDCRALLATLGDASVQCVVTSPPYFGLRDYGTGQWGGGDPACDHAKDRAVGVVSSTLEGGKGTTNHQQEASYRDACGKCGARRVDRQIGLEPSLDAYVATMVAVFREVRRVLRDDGTCWVNLGDSYVSGATGSLGQSFSKDRPGQQAALLRPSKMGAGKPKDLLMMPARVALALQAPDYLGRIRHETDRAWLAALVDGEGCITVMETTSPHGSGNSYPTILQIRMCDVECVEHAAAITGLGNASPLQEPPSQGGIRGSYQWRLNGRKAADTIAEIYPFLRIKRKQAIVAWNHQTVRDSYETKRGVKVPQAAVEKQQFCRDLIQKLNSRQPVDLPSWMIEPPLAVGPGWYVRSDVIWAKPNPMPESVTDRPTNAHEHVFLLTKSARYFYDNEAVREERTSDIDRPSFRGGCYVGGATDNGSLGVSTDVGNKRTDIMSRSCRNVWTIATEAFPDAHFATFPTALAERCIKAGTSERGCCAQCGAPWVREVERAFVPTQDPISLKAGDKGIALGGWESPRGVNSTTTTGWSPVCACNAAVVPCTVLDPFAGAGTTLLVADRLQRHAVGIELSADYIALAERRLASDAPLFVTTISPVPDAEATYDRQPDLFAAAAD